MSRPGLELKQNDQKDLNKKLRKKSGFIMHKATIIRTLIDVSMAGCAVGYWFVHRTARMRLRRAIDVALILCAVISVALFFSLGRGLGETRFFNAHDVFHYYLGSKYAAELSYTYLYEAAAQAALQNGTKLPDLHVRDMETYRVDHFSPASPKAAEAVSRFSSERWREFRGDVSFFVDSLGVKGFQNALRDMGYNATPVWTSVGQTLGRLASPRRTWTMHLLALIDPVLLAAMLLAIARAYGWRPALFVLTALGCCFANAFGQVRGGFLRFD